MSPDLTATISQCVADCTWLARRKYTELALQMRAEFCREWCISVDLWNEQVDELIDYVQRKGETPEVSTRQLLVIRYGLDGYNE